MTRHPNHHHLSGVVVTRAFLRLGFLLALLVSSACTVEMRPDAPMTPDVPLFDVSLPDTSACAPGLIACGGTCTRVAADNANCGSCGNVCPSGTGCAVGRCDCLAPMLACDGLCIDPTADAEHCGTCENGCEPTEICSASECIVMCTAENHRVCVNTDAEGTRTQICADLFNDPMNCGTCNTRCGGGSTCINGVCACPGGGTACSGTCVDTNTDPNNCGACLSSCGPGGTCVGGVCATCGPGLELCGRPSRCINTETSTLHCGACGHACEGGQDCTDGACECMGSLVDCGTGCLDLMSSLAHCGTCGTNCGAGGACTAGVCTCASGFTMCGAECANLMTDASHCNTCDNACGPMQACIAGACVTAPLYHNWPVPTGLVGCSGTSYNTTAPTALGGTYPFNTGDTPACRAWKLAATVCTTAPTMYMTPFVPPPVDNWTCPISGGFTDPVFGTYCRAPGTQYSCSTCPGACNAGACSFRPLSLRNCAGSETAQP